MGIPRCIASAELSKFRFNPYNRDETCAYEVRYNSCIIATPLQAAWKVDLPDGTLHVQLNGKVAFIPYPASSVAIEKEELPKNMLERLFVGQVPYEVSDMQLDWIAQVFCDARINRIERIVKRDKSTGKRLPGGCCHVYCTAEDADALINGLNKRLLIDDTGVWYARTDDEYDQLEEYVKELHSGSVSKYKERPYETVVVEPAKSTYVPR